MRASFVIAIVLVAMPAVAEESGRDLVPSIKDLVPTVKDLVFTVKPLDLRIEDMIRVKEAAKETTIELPADILFDFDKADIRAEAEVALTAAVELIRAAPRAPSGSKAIPMPRALRPITRSSPGAGKGSRQLAGREGRPRQGQVRPEGVRGRQAGCTQRQAGRHGRSGGRQLNRRVEIIFVRK